MQGCEQASALLVHVRKVELEHGRVCGCSKRAHVESCTEEHDLLEAVVERAVDVERSCGHHLWQLGQPLAEASREHQPVAASHLRGPGIREPRRRGLGLEGTQACDEPRRGLAAMGIERVDAAALWRDRGTR